MCIWSTIAWAGHLRLKFGIDYAVKFTIPQRDLVKMLKVVTSNPAVSRKNRDPHLRMEASGGLLTLTANESEARALADVDREGVCYINYKHLLPVVQSFKGLSSLTIEVTPSGMRIGSFRLSDGIWHALFDNPATAPKRYIGRDDPAIRGMTDPDTTIQAWRAFYAQSKPTGQTEFRF